MLLKNIKNQLLGKYKNHKSGIIVCCYYNPTNSKTREKVFYEFYKTIKHLDHVIVEGKLEDQKFALNNITGEHIKVDLPGPAWYKEYLLNLGIKSVLENQRDKKAIFWIDTDIIFSDREWFHKSCEMLTTKGYRMIQPFEYAQHLDENSTKSQKLNLKNIEIENNFHYWEDAFDHRNEKTRDRKVWRSYCSNYKNQLFNHKHYDIHGHVGFAWGATREVLMQLPLFQYALCGGADHIMAHAATSDKLHCCITKTYVNTLELIQDYTDKLFSLVQGKVGSPSGIIAYHLWHGELKKRQYYNRIKTTDKILSKELPKTHPIKYPDYNSIFDVNSIHFKLFMWSYLLDREHEPNTNSLDNLMDNLPEIENIEPVQTSMNYEVENDTIVNYDNTDNSWANIVNDSENMKSKIYENHQNSISEEPYTIQTLDYSEGNFS